MNRLWMLALVAALGWPAAVVGQGPNETRANPENIAAALRLTQAAAAEYEIRVGHDDKPLDLQREPILKWSNPDRGEVHGYVFLWTREGRPLVVASLFKWFTPHTHMSHEFHSFAEGPLRGNFHGNPVWKAGEAGVRFIDLPGAAAPAAGDAQRLMQMKQLAKEFSGVKTERDDGNVVELRLLPQPIYRYAAASQDILTGGLFTLVHGTDPEIFVPIEARGKDAASARWQYAVARMTNSALRLRLRDKEVWAADVLRGRQVTDPERPYTTFFFNAIPDFLKDALAKPNPRVGLANVRRSRI
jgi:hypothetical protein